MQHTEGTSAVRSAVARGDDDVDLLILINSNKKDDKKLQLLFRGRPDQDLARDTTDTVLPSL